jgi:hypothetical protein
MSVPVLGWDRRLVNVRTVQAAIIVEAIRVNATAAAMAGDKPLTYVTLRVTVFNCSLQVYIERGWGSRFKRETSIYL